MALSLDTVQRVAGRRLPGLDAARGLAIVFMAVDHLCVVFAGPLWLRLSVGRLALPVFFVLAGHLARRVSARTVAIAAAGVLLPLVVPWIDAPNVLVYWAVGVCVIAACRRWPAALWAIVVVGLTWGANHFRLLPAGVSSYELPLLLAMMAAGALAGAGLWWWADRLPAWLAALGRHAVWVYIGHLLVLQAVAVIWL